MLPLQTSLIVFVITRSTDCELAFKLSTMVFFDEVSMLGAAAEAKLVAEAKAVCHSELAATSNHYQLSPNRV